ncbi:hypothetical protein C4572_01765 [Candidatus Parcubacteria bacterium]|nr:MAG: hypothetical protein C4572_01765 [Candidatus Parcubacteria bacterium]
MPTTKKRVNISLSSALEDILSRLAKRDQVPQATKAAELIRTAIEIEEDQFFDLIASERDKKGIKFISHKKAWG